MFNLAFAYVLMLKRRGHCLSESVFPPASICAWSSLLLAAVALSANVDSGGGRSSIGNYSNHGAIGSSFGTSVQVSNDFQIIPGWIGVVYGPAQAVDPVIDSDGNGLPDDWELANFGMIGVDPHADSDEDGASNWMEFLTGTDPVDPSSVFRVHPYQRGEDWILPFPTHRGRLYQLWASVDLENWELLDQMAGDDMPIEFLYDLSVVNPHPIFLRLEIHLSDPEL